MLYLLDTDTASYIIKGRSREIQNRLSAIEPTQVCVSAITAAELLFGLKQLPAEHRLHIAVRQFLKTVRVIPWDGDAAGFYAEIRQQLVSTGQPIGELDMMIAAHSLALAAVLVTNNTRHYERVHAPLLLQNWGEVESL